jgi:hypothetical protein
MSKFLRRNIALQSKIYQELQAEARNQLSLHGCFAKADVIKACGFEAVEDSIRWDYIREFLEHDEGCELVPVVSLYFMSPKTKERRENPIELKPEKYLAQGWGKKTAGFVSVKSDENAQLVVVRLLQRAASAEGAKKKVQKFQRDAQSLGSQTLQKAIGQSLLM